REIENSPKSRYQEFFESGRVNCYYLNQLDEGDSLGVKVLQLIVESEQNTLAQGKQLIQQVRQQFQESLKREDILELIETILIYKLPKLNRKEIEKMFSLSDLRETKGLFWFLCGNEVYTDSFFDKIVLKVLPDKHFTIP
ncbi:DUF2887 domain-containing protein, partial [Microcystis aeruginosa]|uniref:DUF2887 domain-containing protein n=1 Tax=Microcystis aeruginosa TaxID=1126 RepID=UPI00232C55A1